MLGKEFKVRPVFSYSSENNHTNYVPKIKGKCVWVHPEGRFALLEFRCGGSVLRECFRPEELQ